MSPIPSPTPLRRTVLRAMFSPAVLVCSFVVFLIFVCPNARGDGLDAGMATSTLRIPGGVDIMALNMPSVSVQPAAPQFHAPRPGRVNSETFRSATLDQRALHDDALEPFQHSRSALPLLVNPVQSAPGKDPYVELSPMVGPAVGVRPKLPAAKR